MLYIHPAGVSACSPLIADYGLTWPIGAPIEDTISATQLIFKSIPVRYPRIKIINSHLGGALPMLLQRLDNQYRWAVPQMTEPPSTQARRMWYDTVGHFHIPALRCACESFGSDRLVLGTDFPYLSGDGYRRSVAYIEDAGLSTSDAHGILDTMSLISVLLAETTRLRIFPNVASLPLRPPALLAKSAASLDILSGGRFELGIGSGASWEGIAAMGEQRRTPGEAILALEEGIAIIRAIWNGQGSLRYRGKYYALRGLQPGPRPTHTRGKARIGSRY